MGVFAVKPQASLVKSDLRWHEPECSRIYPLCHVCGLPSLGGPRWWGQREGDVPRPRQGHFYLADTLPVHSHLIFNWTPCRKGPSVGRGLFISTEPGMLLSSGCRGCKIECSVAGKHSKVTFDRPKAIALQRFRLARVPRLPSDGQTDSGAVCLDRLTHRQLAFLKLKINKYRWKELDSIIQSACVVVHVLYAVHRDCGNIIWSCRY